jgi:hypothetical protein
MGYYTLEQLKTQLAEVQSGISKALEAQSHSTTLGNSTDRAQLSDLRVQRKELMAEIVEKEASISVGNAAGRTYAQNLRRF